VKRINDEGGTPRSRFFCPHSSAYPALEFNGAAERSGWIIGRRMRAGESIPFLPPIFLPAPTAESVMEREADEGVLSRPATEMIR
jgi:hypothetical protein